MTNVTEQIYMIATYAQHVEKKTSMIYNILCFFT